MTDLEQILSLWRELRESGSEYVLATVVDVEGSGYRKPGARMLIAADGRRSGTISGGCLEGEVARKAFWHTEHGPAVRRYSTSAEDGDVPFGMGCGGVVHLLLERSVTAEPALERLAFHFETRRPLAMATVLAGEWIGLRAYAAGVPDERDDATELEGIELDTELQPQLNKLARRAFDVQHSFTQMLHLVDGKEIRARMEWSAARPGLFVFGAGDDAIPVVRQARQLGWFVVVADGRSNLATKTRFPEAHEVRVLTDDNLACPDCRPTDAAAVMTHSLEQDTRVLRELMRRDVLQDLGYIGVLGPRRRTKEILSSLALEIQAEEGDANLLAESWLGRVHAPMGLDLGGETPADIALALVAEIQQTIYRGSGLPLRAIRRRGEAEKVMAVQVDWR